MNDNINIEPSELIKKIKHAEDTMRGVIDEICALLDEDAVSGLVAFNSIASMALGIYSSLLSHLEATTLSNLATIIKGTYKATTKTHKLLIDGLYLREFHKQNPGMSAVSKKPSEEHIN